MGPDREIVVGQRFSADLPQGRASRHGDFPWLEVVPTVVTAQLSGSNRQLPLIEISQQAAYLNSPPPGPLTLRQKTPKMAIKF